MIRRLLPLALVLALAACTAPSGREMYPTSGTALAPTAAPLEWEAAPEPVELPDPAVTRDAPRGPPPLPGDPIPPNRRMGGTPPAASLGIPPGFGDLPTPPAGRRAY